MYSRWQLRQDVVAELDGVVARDDVCKCAAAGTPAVVAVHASTSTWCFNSISVCQVGKAVKGRFKLHRTIPVAWVLLTLL
jgi:hypothetical protein